MPDAQQDFAEEQYRGYGGLEEGASPSAMNTPNNHATHSSLPCNAQLTSLLLAFLLTLAACTTQRLVNLTPPPLRGFDDPVQIDDVDVLAVSPAMEAFLERYVLPYSNLNTRLDLLTLAVLENGVLGFTYSDSKTSTAAATFDKRTGNCLSHANMLIALARRAGIDARYQEVLIQPEWTSREKLLVLSKHINVVLSSPLSRLYVDVSGTKPSQAVGHQILSDREGEASFYVNLGVEALIDDDLPTAYAYMIKAIDIAPQIADPWVNLGVVFSRNGQLAEAEIAYNRALQIDPGEYSAMNNLYAIYRSQNKFEVAEALQKKVQDHRRKNPYYLLMLSSEALEESRFEESISLLKRAIRQNESDHRLHFALARTLYLSGDTAAAERSLRRARRFAPKNSPVDYNRPLNELIDPK